HPDLQGFCRALLLARVKLDVRAFYARHLPASIGSSSLPRNCGSLQLVAARAMGSSVPLSPIGLRADSAPRLFRRGPYVWWGSGAVGREACWPSQQTFSLNRQRTASGGGAGSSQPGYPDDLVDRLLQG